MKRTDPHKPGSIVPFDYEYVLSYCSPGSQPWDNWNMDAVRALCENIGWGRGETKMFGHVGKCGICGATYRNGDMWRHVPTGDIVHVGHNCADKYSMVTERPGFEAALELLKKRRAAFIAETKRQMIREKFLATVPGLEEALSGDHDILRNMSASLTRWGSLTPRQVAFAMKLSTETKARKENPPPEEKHVPAPTGRQVIRGLVVSKKSYDSDQYGPSTKITVKVETPEGSWLAWGSTFGAVERGDLVEFKATLSPGRDPHFAFFKRPMDGRIINEQPETAPCTF
jgi:hypothetical protein